MRISRLELDGIGPFEGAVFEIPAPPEGSRGELVLFEGPNGCGKTTIALAIALAAAPSMLGASRSNGIGFPAPFWSGRCHTTGGSCRVRVEHEGRTISEDIHGDRIEWIHGEQEKSLSSASLSPGLISYDPASTFRTPFDPSSWMAFAFQGHQSTPMLGTLGPREIEIGPLRFSNIGFGSQTAAPLFGQMLINMDYDRARAALYAQQAPSDAERSRFQEAIVSSTERIHRMEEALSTIVDRVVNIRFEMSQLSPRILFDGAEIPLEYLGEGLRSTVAWLADLLVRLELTPWDRSDARSPFEQDFWLILDEVEVNLHPRMQAHLFPALRRLFPNARIYATVHSPFAVAAAGEGHVFPIRPQRATRRVTGLQEPLKLAHGQSLSWVVEEVFDTPSMFLDVETRRALELHDQEVRSLLAGKAIDWPAFLERRRWLMGLNDEVATIVAMREVAVQRRIDAQLEGRSS